MKLRKIPLENFIVLLQELYEEGADYIDIAEEQDPDGSGQDVIEITVEPDYFFDEEEEDSSFTEGDINDLI